MIQHSKYVAYCDYELYITESACDYCEILLEYLLFDSYPDWGLPLLF